MDSKKTLAAWLLVPTLAFWGAAGTVNAQGRDILLQAASKSGKGYVVAIDNATGATREIEVGKSASAGPVDRRYSQTYFTDYDDGKVIVLDTAFGQDFAKFASVKATVTVGKQPWSVWPSLDQEKFLVTNEGDATISVIEGKTATVTQTISTCSTPRWIVYGNDASRYFVSCYGSGTVGIIDAATMTMTSEIAVGKGPEAMITLGKFLLVANQTGKEIAVIDTTTNKVVKTLPLSISPYRFRLSNLSVKPTVLVLGNGTGDKKIAYVQIDQSEADSAATVVREIDVGGTSRQIALSSNREKAFVAVYDAGSIVVLNNLTGAMTNNILIGGNPRSIVAGNDGFLYATSRTTNTMTVIDPENETVVKTYPLTDRTAGNTTTVSPMPASGLWYSPHLSGTAYAIQIAGRNIHLATFVYRADGSPVWYVAGGRLSTLAEGTSTPVLEFSGTLAEYKNGPTLASGTGQAAWLGDVAKIRLSAATANQVNVWLETPSGGTNSTTIKPYEIIPGGGEAVPEFASYTPLWTWVQAEPGTGYFADTQGRTTFTVYAMYDASGRATWYYGVASSDSALSLAQPLMQASGGPTVLGLSSPLQATEQVGNVSLVRGQNGSYMTLPGRTVRLSGFRF